jgi:hypothetical protein
MKKYFLYSISLFIFSLTGCQSLESLTGADEASWQSSDYQTKLYSSLTYIEQSGRSLLDSKPIEPDSLLIVRLTQGKAKMWPDGHVHAFKPTIYSLASGSCHNIKLTAVDDINQSTTLKSCFKDDQLVLDPSRWNYNYKNGSIFIKSSPLWQQDGVVYDQLSSEGYAKLTDLSIDVHFSHATG